MTPPPSLLVRAFAPIHKRALGLAVGITSGIGVFLVTAFEIIAKPDGGLPIWLLAQYFYGYEISWRGAFVGLWWGFIAGFAAGWFVAFCRNFALATWVLVIRARASLHETSDFLDHI